MRAVLIFPGSCIPCSPSCILYRVNAFNFSFDRSLMYSWYVFVIEIWKSSGKRNRTENFHSRELSRRIGLSCSQYEFPFRLDFTPRSFRLWKIVVTIVTECIIRGIQHDIHIYIYTRNTIHRVYREEGYPRVSFMEVARRQDVARRRKETSSPDNSNSGK